MEPQPTRLRLVTMPVATTDCDETYICPCATCRLDRATLVDLGVRPDKPQPHQPRPARHLRVAA